MTISNRTVEKCIEECLQCLRWCAQCRAESLDQDPVMMRDCIRFCNECIDVCRTCVALLTASSGFAHRVCSICSELCTACAAECGKHEGETMRKCAQACRQCAATCAEGAQGGPIRRLRHRAEKALYAGDRLWRPFESAFGEERRPQAVARAVADADALGRPAQTFAESASLGRCARERPDHAGFVETHELAGAGCRAEHPAC